MALPELDIVPEMLFREAKCCREIEFCFSKILTLYVQGTDYVFKKGDDLMKIVLLKTFLNTQMMG